MNQIEKLERIFDAKPECGWGLRGDPYMWNLLRGNWSSGALPNSAEEFKAAIERFYERITGVSVNDARHLSCDGDECDSVPFFEKIGHGSSAGQVSRATWREQYIPLLVERYKVEFDSGVSKG